VFTGIIKGLGRVTAVDAIPSGRRLTVASPLPADAVLGPGDSIAVSGVCLTAVDFPDGGFAAEVSPETLRLTTLGALAVGDTVNLEPALRPSDPLGGHIVTGHVDGMAEVTATTRKDGFLEVEFTLEPGNESDLSRYLARKGSVAVDGVSLTVNAVGKETFTVMLIPHTLDMTTLSMLTNGRRVNIEVDLMARYAERMLNP